MFSLLKQRAIRAFPNITHSRVSFLKSSYDFSSRISDPVFIGPKASKLFIGSTAAIFAALGIGYALSSSEKEKVQNYAIVIDEFPSVKLTKKDAKIMIQQAVQLENEGQNSQALNLYLEAYKIYRRALKGSNKKMTFLRHRIAILTSFEGKAKRALLYMMDGYTEASMKTFTEELHFEMYYDLCVLYYKFGQFSCCIKMMKSCLELVDGFHEEEKELLFGIHQFIGFSYMRRGQIAQGEQHLTIALDYLNKIKEKNKAFLYYACTEMSDFYATIGDYKKALLFVEQAKIVLNQKDFFSQESIEKGMNLHSHYTKKFIQDLRFDVQNEKLEHKKRVFRSQLGDYGIYNQKRNTPWNKLTKDEKNPHVHSLLRW